MTPMLVPMAATAVGASILTLALMPGVVALLRRLRAYDEPTSRSSHSWATLRGGGLAPAAAVVAIGLAIPSVGWQVDALIVGAAAGYGLLGLLEDLWGMGIALRLGLQVLGALGVVVLLGLFGHPWPWAVALASIAVLWIVGYVNAFNFMDGINGIAGAQALLAGVAFALMALRVDDAGLGLHSAIIAGAALGFLPFNFPTARVFLGDIGSYFLGAYLAVLVVIAVQGGLPVVAALAPTLPYLADTSVTLIKRFLRGEPLSRPHREHVYQRLTQVGWSHARVTVTVSVVITGTSALGYAAIGAGPLAGLAYVVGMVLILGSYLLLPALPFRRVLACREGRTS